MMNELAQTIKELRNAAAAIDAAASWLAEAFGGENVPAKPAPTLEEVRPILAEKSRNGYTVQIRELLHKYGAVKLSEVDPARYEALVRDVEAITDAT